MDRLESSSSDKILPVELEAGKTYYLVSRELAGTSADRYFGMTEVDAAPGLAADGQEVPQSAVADVYGAHPLTLQDRVGSHGGAVHRPQSNRIQAQITNALQDRLLRGHRGREHLVNPQPATVKADEIRESSACIYTKQHSGTVGAVAQS